MLLTHDQMRDEIKRQKAVDVEYVLSISPDDVEAALDRLFQPAKVEPRKLIQHDQARREVK